MGKIEERYILIADDNDINRLLLKKTISDKYIPIEAKNGKEALEILNSKKYNIVCILLDLEMPVMDGYEFLKIYSEKHLFEVPIIVITASNDHQTEEKVIKMGASDFFYKPFDTNILLLKIDNNINKNKVIKMKAYQEKLEYDSLTDVYNRVVFFNKVLEYFATNGIDNLALICTDVVNFSQYNTLFGRENADSLLIKIASLLKKKCAKYNTPLGRLASDSFCFLYPLDKINFNNFSDELKYKSIGNHLTYDAKIHFGVYVIKDLTLSVDKMSQYALLAIKSIKSSNVNVAYFDDAVTKNLYLHEHILNDMKKAIENEEFIVHYQPIVSLSTQKVVSCEALVRWKHPTLGLIPPNEFIPLFEHNGFISELDRYVWNRVCADLEKKMLECDYETIPISINISRIDFYDDNLVEDINEILKKHHIDHSKIRIEITESAFQDDPKRLIEITNKFKNNNYTIMMDDFGTGYSSLESLGEIPIDVIKLDMKFIKNLEKDSKNAIIVSSILRMCKLLDLSVVAEGVEKIEQREFLKSIGCEYGQGYLYSKPLPLDEFQRFVEGNRETNLHKISLISKDNNLRSVWDAEKTFSNMFSNMVSIMGAYEYDKEYGITLTRVNNSYLEFIGGKQPHKYGDPNIQFKKDYIINKSNFDNVLNEAKKSHENAKCLIHGEKYDGSKYIALLTVRHVGTIINRDEYIFTMQDVSESETKKRELEKLQSIFDLLKYRIVKFELSSNMLKLFEINGSGSQKYDVLKGSNIFDMICENEMNKVRYIIHAIENDNKRVHQFSVNLLNNPLNVSSINIIVFSTIKSKNDKTIISAIVFENNQRVQTMDDIMFNSPNPFYIANVENNELMFANKAFCDLFKINSEKIWEYKCYNAIYNCKSKCDDCVLNLLKNYDDHETTSIEKDDKIFTSYHSLMNWNGQDSHVVFMMDNTKLHELIQENDLLFDVYPGFIIKMEVNIKTKELKVNAIKGNALSCTGYNNEELKELFQQKQFDKIIFDESVINEDFIASVKKKSKVEYVIKFIKKDGKLMYLKATTSYVEDGGDVIEFTTSFTDVNQEHKDKLRTQKVADKYKALAQGLSIITFEYSVSKKSLSFESLDNDGKTISEVIPDYLNYIKISPSIHDVSRKTYYEGFVHAINNPGKYTLKYLHNIFSNGFRWGLATYQSIVDDNGKVVKIIGRVDDITSIQEQNEKTLKEANLDFLSGLINRNYYELIVNEHNGVFEKSCLTIIDLDDFKKVNDTYGHLVGDRVIKYIGLAIRESIKSYDIASRYGGDEFIIIFGHIVSLDVMDEVVNKIINKFNEMLKTENMQIGVSYGYALLSDDKSFDETFKEADQMLYAKKQNKAHNY